MPRILITAFGPFPGAPSNPSMAVARHLLLSRHPRFRGVGINCHILPTHWRMLKDFREGVLQDKPDAILMFGLAGRRRQVTPETRAINHAGILRLDAAGKAPSVRHLTSGANGFKRSSIDATRMVAALRQAKLPARQSHDAGDYLCNALLWTALETGVPAIFIHIPRPRRLTRPTSVAKRPRPLLRDLKRAAEVALLQVLRAV